MSKHTDALTGLPNHKALEKALQERIERDEPVALALIDVDHFHEVNHLLGSEAGDEVLKRIAEMLSEEGGASAFRVSGDEFAIALDGVSLEQAFLGMEKLRLRVETDQGSFALPDGQTLTLTIGVAQYPRDGKTEGALRRAASAALVSAKETGRNQVALPPNEEMVMKSCYYPSTNVRRLKSLAEQLNKKESALLREALDDLLRKYDRGEIARKSRQSSDS
ncbi:diguanylate cyclase domain-containing protein [Paenibacillus hodogayensis]|uniref:Diguanylate cyclase domain-containing protein n=1 Tax=Paenibacillus hodogayensis TaxID=279208 RepID=A0ABV5VX65_9BACL